MRAIHLIVAVATIATVEALPPAPQAQAQVLVSVTVAPPPMPVYVQPAVPGPDYIWSPGYWAWGPGGYYWVPGTWVLAPAPGLLWTPGYWAWSDGVYLWRAGYWGPRVGFYGGVNYGCGYTGVGYQGGYWNGRVFMYNTAVNVGAVRVTNVYNKTVINTTTVTNVSFNGGKGGIVAQPNAQELAAVNDKHIPATSMQAQHEHAAGGNHELLASVNHGHPLVAATTKAAVFTGAGIVAAKGINAAAAKSLGRAGPAGPKPPGLNAAKLPGPPGPKPPGQFNQARMLGPSGVRPPPRQYRPPNHPQKP